MDFKKRHRADKEKNMIDLKKLQNGSDIRGVAIQTEGGPEPNLTRETAGQITGAFIYWLSKKDAQGRSS